MNIQYFSRRIFYHVKVGQLFTGTEIVILFPGDNLTIDFRILLETGNYNLLKSFQRTEKIYETKRTCRCTDIRPEDLKRKGRVFIHRVCRGWYPYDLGVHLKNREKKSREPIKYYRVSATARSY